KVGDYQNYMGNQGNYDQTLIVDRHGATNPDFFTIIAGGQADVDPHIIGGYPDGGVIRSQDGGTTWTNITIGADGIQPHVDHHAMAFDVTGRLLDGNDGGIWRLDDPNAVRNSFTNNIHWTNLNGDLQITQFTGIALHPTDSLIAFGGSQDNGTE